MIDPMEARVGTRGRVTIPIEIRRSLGIKAGTRLIVREEEGRIVVMTMASYVRSLRGVLKGNGMMERFLEERRSERLREDGQARP
jgi:AbrB family looped-hinge helix DNA binding protein